MHNTTVVERDLNDHTNVEDDETDDDDDDTHLPWAQWTRTAFPLDSSSNASLTVDLNTFETIIIVGFLITVMMIVEFEKKLFWSWTFRLEPIQVKVKCDRLWNVMEIWLDWMKGVKKRLDWMRKSSTNGSSCCCRSSLSCSEVTFTFRHCSSYEIDTLYSYAMKYWYAMKDWYVMKD